MMVQHELIYELYPAQTWKDARDIIDQAQALAKAICIAGHSKAYPHTLRGAVTLLEEYEEAFYTTDEPPFAY